MSGICQNYMGSSLKNIRQRDKERQKENKKTKEVILHANFKHAVISKHLFVRSATCIELTDNE